MSTRRLWAALLTFAGIVSAAVTMRDPADRPAAPLAAGHALGAIQPRLSGDGSAIAFSYQGAIWVVPRSGGTARRLTRGTGIDTEPVWSPDGRRLAYVNSPAMGEGELRIVDVVPAEANPQPQGVRVAGTILYTKLEFHPDGNRVLGVFRHGSEVWVGWCEVSSGTITPVAKVPAWSRYALSPDGGSIVYTSTMDVDGQQMGNDGPQADVWKIPSTGGEPVKLTRFPSRIHDLCFTADGAGLIVATERGGAHNDLWHVSISATAQPTKLTYGQADEDRPSVSTDGRWLLFTENSRGATALVLRNLIQGVDQTVPIDQLDFGAAAGTLQLAIVDQPTGRPVTARVALVDHAGKHHAPPGTLHRLLGGLGHFYRDSAGEWSLPAGDYTLRVFRGPEYRAAEQTVTVAAGKTAKITVPIERWTDQAARGWHSGENHIHANYGYGEWYCTPATMLQQCAGEDLHVCNFMVANSDTDGIFDREFFSGRPDPLSTGETILYWNQEFRSTIWGHMTLVNLEQVVEPIMTGFRGTTNPWDVPTNANVADAAHRQKGLVNYTHVAQNAMDPYAGPYTGKGIPINVALGKIDSLDLNASYAGTVPLWYRLLNCGFRLPASAGTDTFLNRIRSRLPGGDRVYVQFEGPLSYSKWIDGLRAGRSFVTNGPMLELTVDGKGPGETVTRTEPAELRIMARATAQFPMESAEIVSNGQVALTAKLSADRLSAEFASNLKLDHSGWLAFRAAGPGHRDHPLGSLYGHTSPIYVTIEGRPADSRSDAKFFLDWIARLSVEFGVRDRVPDDAQRRRIQEQLEAARAVYVSLGG